MISLLKQQFFAIGAHLSQALYNLFISELRWNTQQQVFKLAQRIQQQQRALTSHDLSSGPLSLQFTYYGKLRPLAVCIHKEGLNLCKVYPAEG